MKMKKNIAVVMSAVMAAGVAAPVVANAADTTQTVDRQTVIEKVKEALAKRYTDKKADGKGGNTASGNEVLNSVYEIEYRIEEGDWVKNTGETFNKADDLINELKTIADKGKSFEVKVINKGFEEKDGKILAVKTTTNKIFTTKNNPDNGVYGEKMSEALSKTVKINGEDVSIASILAKIVKTEGIAIHKGDDVSYISADAVTADVDEADKLVITLKGGQTVEIKNGADLLDFAKPLDEKGNEIKIIDLDNENMKKRVAKFEVVENKSDKTDELIEQDVDIEEGDAVTYKVDKVTKTLVYNLSDLYSDENGYNDKGADLINAIRKLKDGKKANIEGVNYDGSGASVDAKVDYEDGKYVLKVNLNGLVDTVDSTLDVPTEVDLTIIIKGDDIKEANTVRDDIETRPEDVVAGKFNRLVGADRYKTAIEVSKERFKEDEAQSVVIVGADAVTDGLSAAPLAAVKNAPVLLANKNGELDSATINEIKRATKDLKNKVVYIVGGEASVPGAVGEQLKREFGAVVVRLAGNDRYDTSTEVAKRLNDDAQYNGDVYFVGGKGEADAMSISAVAARRNVNGVSPIIVMNKDGFNRDTRKTLNNLVVDKSYVIGGPNSVSYLGLEEIRKLNPTVLERISGDNRYATNAAVIKKFEGIAPKKLYVASADSKYLVDAQTAGALAAEAANNGAPILLAGPALDKTQKDLFGDNFDAGKVIFEKGKVDLTQVGGVVNANTMKEIVKALGL